MKQGSSRCEAVLIVFAALQTPSFECGSYKQQGEEAPWLYRCKLPVERFVGLASKFLSKYRFQQLLSRNVPLHFHIQQFFLVFLFCVFDLDAATRCHHNLVSLYRGQVLGYYHMCLFFFFSSIGRTLYHPRQPILESTADGKSYLCLRS